MVQQVQKQGCSKKGEELNCCGLGLSLSLQKDIKVIAIIRGTLKTV